MSTNNQPIRPTNLTHLVARDEANKAIASHETNCDLHKNQIEPRLRMLECSHAKILGYMLGTSVTTSSLTATLIKLFT
jgi:hypothetical protein